MRRPAACRSVKHFNPAATQLMAVSRQATQRKALRGTTRTAMCIFTCLTHMRDQGEDGLLQAVSHARQHAAGACHRQRRQQRLRARTQTLDMDRRLS